MSVTTPTVVDRLRLDQGSPLEAARRIARLAHRRKVRLTPGLYLSASGQGMACFVGLLSAELYRDLNTLSLDNGELIASFLLAMDDRAYTPNIPADGRDDLPKGEQVAGSDDGDDLREFIADHSASLSLDDIERIEAGFENTFYFEYRDNEGWWRDQTGFAENIRPSQLKGHERAGWRNLTRMEQIGYYLRLMAYDIIS